MADNPVVNGIPVAGDDIGGIVHQLIGVEFGPADGLTRVTTTNPMPVTDPGTFAYAAGTTAATVDVPTTAKLRRVSVLAGASAATVTIGGGATITIPAGIAFDESVAGAAVGADVVIGGTVTTYYVAWTT